MSDYQTAGCEACDEFVERRSRFIGYVRPASTEEEAISFVNKIKSKHWNATHNVYAYVLRSGQIRRYSDDGEPQGTAGIPVLDVLLKSNITDTVVVVTRYFGGILLGAGGLVRAYSHGASLALQKSGIVCMKECILLHTRCDYSTYGRVAALIPECGGIIDDTTFTEEVSIDFHMPPELLPAFSVKLADATNGQISYEKGDLRFFACE